MTDPRSLGYGDTPFISGNKWRVHDGERPQPRIVSPGTESSPDVPGAAPSDAIMLFDGRSLDGWSKKAGGEAEWKLEGGYMEVAPGTGNICTDTKLGDCQMHLEWMEPEVIKGDGQGRGNSGVFMMELYEIQVLDGYENPTYADGTCGGLYGQCPPLVNPSRKPGEWQSYEVVWTAPRFDGDRLVSPAYVTVLQNGVLIHHHKELIGPTRHKITTCYQPHPPEAPLMLQDHGDLVRYRNIWYRPLSGYDES